MWLPEAHRKGLHILGGCLNIWVQGFRPFLFFSCFRCVDTNCFLPSKYSSKPTFYRRRFLFTVSNDLRHVLDGCKGERVGLFMI